MKNKQKKKTKRFVASFRLKRADPFQPGSRRSEDIFDFVYVDAFGRGKQLTAKECEYLIGHQVTADYYGAISTTELLLRMVGNLLNIGKRG